MKAKILSGILALAAVFCLTSCINEEKSAAKQTAVTVTVMAAAIA